MLVRVTFCVCAHGCVRVFEREPLRSSVTSLDGGEAEMALEDKRS